jgi:hypothetical protein
VLLYPGILLDFLGSHSLYFVGAIGENIVAASS